jgi:hypothetical protein
VLWPPDPRRARRILVPSLPIHPPPPTCNSNISENVQKITQPRIINLYGIFVSDCPSIYTFHSSKGGCGFIQISWFPAYPSIRHHRIPAGAFISEHAQKITQPQQINLYGIFVSDCPSIYTFYSSKGGCGLIQISWCPAYPSIHHQLPAIAIFQKTREKSRNLDKKISSYTVGI